MKDRYIIIVLLQYEITTSVPLRNWQKWGRSSGQTIISRTPYSRSTTETVIHPIGQNILLIYPHFGTAFKHGPLPPLPDKMRLTMVCTTLFTPCLGFSERTNYRSSYAQCHLDLPLLRSGRMAPLHFRDDPRPLILEYLAKADGLHRRVR